MDSALRDEAGDFSRQTGSGASDRAAVAQDEKKTNASSAMAATPASPLQFGEELQFFSEKVL